MHLFNFASILTLCALVVDAANTIVTPALGDNVYAKDSLKITWKPDTPGPITITLRFGAANSLAQGTQIAKSIANSGSYSWTVPEEFGSGIYTVELKDDKNGQVNYSSLFSLSGGRGIQGTTISLPGSTPSPTVRDVASASMGAARSTGTSGASFLGAETRHVVAAFGLGAFVIL